MNLGIKDMVGSCVLGSSPSGTVETENVQCPGYQGRQVLYKVLAWRST